MGKGRSPKSSEEYSYDEKERKYKKREKDDDFTPEQTLRWLRSVYRENIYGTNKKQGS